MPTKNERNRLIKAREEAYIETLKAVVKTQERLIESQKEIIAARNEQIEIQQKMVINYKEKADHADSILEFFRNCKIVPGPYAPRLTMYVNGRGVASFNPPVLLPNNETTTV